MRAADAGAPNLAYPPKSRLPTTDVKPLVCSKCRRRRRGPPECRRHARGGGRFPVLLPLRARNRLWFGPTKQFRMGRSMANRRFINSKVFRNECIAARTSIFKPKFHARPTTPEVSFELDFIGCRTTRPQREGTIYDRNRESIIIGPSKINNGGITFTLFAHTNREYGATVAQESGKPLRFL